MKLCLGLKCADKRSRCCNAPCVADRVKDLFLCQLCQKEFDPQACTAGENPNNHECIIGKCHPDIHKQKKELVDLVFTKEAMHDAAQYANFSQLLKMLMWERGFSGEEKMEEVATILFERYVKKV